MSNDTFRTFGSTIPPILGLYRMQGKFLGEGRFGRVELATHILLKIDVAVKIIDTSYMKPRYLREHFCKEGAIHSKLSHPRIVYMYENFWHKQYYCLVLDYFPNGTLRNLVDSQPDKRLKECIVRKIAQDVISALIYLHSVGIIYRDLKMENILLDEYSQAKIIDFGTATHADQFYSHNTRLALEYAAPEMLTGDAYDYSVDVWSFGIVVYAMMMGELPFKIPYSMYDSYQSRKTRFFQITAKGLPKEKLENLEKLSSRCRILLESVLEPRAYKRMPLKDLKNNKWISYGYISWNSRVNHIARSPCSHVMYALMKVTEILGVSINMVEQHFGKYQRSSVTAMRDLLIRALGTRTIYGTLSDIAFIPSNRRSTTNIVDKSKIRSAIWRQILRRMENENCLKEHKAEIKILGKKIFRLIKDMHALIEMSEENAIGDYNYVENKPDIKKVKNSDEDVVDGSSIVLQGKCLENDVQMGKVSKKNKQIIWSHDYNNFPSSKVYIFKEHISSDVLCPKYSIESKLYAKDKEILPKITNEAKEQDRTCEERKEKATESISLKSGKPISRALFMPSSPIKINPRTDCPSDSVPKDSKSNFVSDRVQVFKREAMLKKNRRR